MIQSNGAFDGFRTQITTMFLNYKPSSMRFVLFFTLMLGANVSFGSPACLKFLEAKKQQFGIHRVESLLGRNTSVYDLSGTITEARAKTDPTLRVVNLGQIFPEGKVFVGFGRPNVFIGIPNVSADGLGFVKVDAKSLRRADTKIVNTKDKIQSGLLMVFPDLTEQQISNILTAAQSHEGTRQWTCVNANCRILSDAGFTLGGQSLSEYYFPIPLLSDILKHGLELDGIPVQYQLVKTTPGYLEDIGLSIKQSVWTTLCRHAERSCGPIKKRLMENSFIVRLNSGTKKVLGLALFNRESSKDKPLPKPILEAEQTRISVPANLLQDYELQVSEPSQLGVLLRLIWGPHSLFEIPLDRSLVDGYLPEKLESYPGKNLSLSTRLKKNVVFNPKVVGFLHSQMAKNYKRVSNLDQGQLFDMLRTHTEDIPNKYNYVIVGDRLIILKIEIGNKYVDWILSKHVLMANYSKDVRFAGEIWKSADGIIHFNIIFPGVNVEAEGL